MVKLITFILMVAVSAFGAAYQTTNSGLFSDGATWTGGTAPSSSGDTWRINAGHDLTYDYNNSAHADGWGVSTNNGTLRMVGDCHIKMNGNIVATNTGLWLIGTNGVPIVSGTNIDTVRIEFKTGSYTVNNTNGILWYGDTNIFVNYCSNYLAIGDTNIYFTNAVVGVQSNDVLWIAEPAKRGTGGTYHTVWGVFTNCIVLNNAHQFYATNTWPGIAFGGAIGTSTRTNTYVLKLSRSISCFQPVKITGTSIIMGTTKTNVYEGVRVTNSGRGLINAGDYSAFSYCSAQNLTSALIFYGIGSTIKWSDVTGTSGGGIINNGSYVTVENCHGGENIGGSILGTSFNSTATNCTAVNCNEGAIIYAGSFNNAIDCLARWSLNGFSQLGSCHIIKGSKYIEGHTGLNYAGTQIYIENCQAFDVGYGAIANGAIGLVVVNCSVTKTNSNSGSGLVSCNIAEVYGNPISVKMESDGTSASHGRYLTASVNGTNWLTANGNAFLTNGIITHAWGGVTPKIPAVNASTAWVQANTRSTLRPVVSLWLTNGVSYMVEATQNRSALFYSPTLYTNASMGWTNITVTMTNTFGVTTPYRIFVNCDLYATNNVGYSKITIPADTRTSLMP
jgi:hypothetical protein